LARIERQTSEIAPERATARSSARNNQSSSAAPIDRADAERPATVKAIYGCIKAFSESEFTRDLEKLDVPTLVLHGDDDQIVPFANSAQRTAKLVKCARLEVFYIKFFGTHAEYDRIDVAKVQP
jgi:pimeloyl-ACP methyl ester carboxylesterase